MAHLPSFNVSGKIDLDFYLVCKCTMQATRKKSVSPTTNSREMNSNNNNNSNRDRRGRGRGRGRGTGRAGAARRPFCKVCQDAGKSEDVYRSHWVRSKPRGGGHVTCPILLATECRYCHKQGHTPSRCPELKKNKRARARGAPPRQVQERDRRTGRPTGFTVVGAFRGVRATEASETPNEAKTVDQLQGRFGALGDVSDEEIGETGGTGTDTRTVPEGGEQSSRNLGVGSTQLAKTGRTTCWGLPAYAPAQAAEDEDSDDDGINIFSGGAKTGTRRSWASDSDSEDDDVAQANIRQ